MESLGVVSQGPEILETGRFVKQPGGSRSRPAVAFVIDLIVQEALEKRVIPAAFVNVFRELLGCRDEGFAILVSKSFISPVAAVVMPLDRRRPIFVQRQVEGFERNTFAR